MTAWVADVHFWNYQGREVLVYSLIDEAHEECVLTQREKVRVRVRVRVRERESERVRV